MNIYWPVISRNGQDFSEDAAMQFSVVEYIILSLFGAMLLATICISVWSGILLAFGNIEGGGPLGMLINIWQNF